MSEEICPKTSPVEDLLKDSIWANFISDKQKSFLEDPIIKKYDLLYNDKKCRSIAKDIASGNHTFSIPKKKLISKNHYGKKRVVYTYDEYEMMSLRIIAHQLHGYDYLFSPNLYSFRRSTGVKDAIFALKNNKNLSNMYGYKTDIHDYFNSINVDDLLSSIKNDVDSKFYSMTEQMLTDDRISFHDEIIHEKKGVMAGTPISPFLANYYLREIDRHFLSKDCIYMRYADDIILFANSKEDLDAYRNTLLSMIHKKGLEMNPDKEQYFEPGDEFEFLGFSIRGNEVDISRNTVFKMKGKIRRSSRSIRRWMLKKNAPIEGTMKALIRRYNTKFFGCDDNELTWSRWFFPSITTSKSLHEIDVFLQEHIRYVATGRFNKKNYDIVPYEKLKELGYRSLVSEYYNSMKRIYSESDIE